MCVCVCVYVCVCHEVSQTCCGRILRRTAFVLGSFERSIPLVWAGVKVLPCHVTLTYLFSAEVTPPTKIAFFSLCLVDLWENGRIYRNYFNGQLLEKWVWAFQWQLNQPPQLDPFPHLGGRKHEKNAKNGFSHFQMIKQYSVVKFFRSKTSSSKVVCTYVWKISVNKVSKSVHNYTFYTDLSESPRLTHMR